MGKNWKTEQTIQGFSFGSIAVGAKFNEIDQMDGRTVGKNWKTDGQFKDFRLAVLLLVRNSMKLTRWTVGSWEKTGKQTDNSRIFVWQV
jgi:hypothetical protein